MRGVPWALRRSERHTGRGAIGFEQALRCRTHGGQRGHARWRLFAQHGPLVFMVEVMKSTFKPLIE